MVTQDDLARIRTIVEGAYANHFGDHETDLMLEARVDHYGYDVVDVVFLFDETPPGLGGRKTVDFQGQIDDEMIEENLPHRHHLRVPPAGRTGSRSRGTGGAVNPEHWLDVAEQLLRDPRRGAPRQVNLRCAVSLIRKPGSPRETPWPSLETRTAF